MGSRELGLGMKGGKHGPFWRSIERACRFGAAQRSGQALAVRKKLPPLTSRQIERLPPHLKTAHDAWLAERMNMSKRQTIAKWGEQQRISSQNDSIGTQRLPRESPDGEPAGGEASDREPDGQGSSRHPAEKSRTRSAA